jgi:N-acyl-D-amino-acid deacylase
LRDYYYACGWLVRPAGEAGKANFWHTGSLPGTHALWVRRHDRLSWIALFNQRSEVKSLPDGALDPAFHRAAARVQAWPSQDLFRPGRSSG